MCMTAQQSPQLAEPGVGALYDPKAGCSAIRPKAPRCSRLQNPQ